ncbi:MAG: DUF2075 domain-containing protein, partial [Planctomycetes bacterium]|nr:DUF2075 domain-containing protein [Planctomycetota bacterium]
MFKGSGVYTECEENTLNALIVDEAHRLNEKSGMFQNKGENQIKEIIMRTIHSNRLYRIRLQRGVAHLMVRIAVLLVLLTALLICPAFSQTRIVIGPGQDPVIDGAKRAQIIDAVCEALNEVYVFADKAEEMEALVRSKLAEGGYDGVDGLARFTALLTEDLRSVCHDRHLSVDPFMGMPQDEGSKITPEEAAERRLDELRYRNFGFEKIERLPGNIGYLDLRGFMDAGTAGPTAIAAMNFLCNCDALIFDLRKNGGGSPSMIQLLSSYLFEEPVHLNDFYIRRGDETKQFWSHAYVEGKRMPDVPVFVLTSNYTFSGAEEFTYNLKNLERATIIGETTGGGAHPVEFKAFDGLNVQMSLPFGRAINPITGTNWEGTGVEPHISVPADKALEVARLEAMKTLLEKEENEERRARLEWEKSSLDAQLNPITLSAEKLHDYTGTFGPRTIRLKEECLHYAREGRGAYKLVPMGEDLFGLEGLDAFRIRFERDEQGRVTKLTGLYDNGMRDSHDRTGS